MAKSKNVNLKDYTANLIDLKLLLDDIKLLTQEKRLINWLTNTLYSLREECDQLYNQLSSHYLHITGYKSHEKNLRCQDLSDLHLLMDALDQHVRQYPNNIPPEFHASLQEYRRTLDTLHTTYNAVERDITESLVTLTNDNHEDNVQESTQQLPTKETSPTNLAGTNIVMECDI